MPLSREALAEFVESEGFPTAADIIRRGDGGYAELSMHPRAGYTGRDGALKLGLEVRECLEDGLVVMPHA